ncbi:MAG: hypothetical protein Q7S92_00745 [Candidatus Diapherotrites archaeon]|nr:hypothetical protein [Candidatus Diapherotrites archaeon]
MNSNGFFSIIGFLILASLIVFSGFELERTTELNQALLIEEKWEIQKLKENEIQENLKTVWKENIRQLILKKEIETLKLKQTLVQATFNFLENYVQIDPELNFYIEHENQINSVSVLELNSIIFVTIIHTQPVFWIKVQITQTGNDAKLCWKKTIGTNTFHQCLPQQFELEALI